MNSTIDRKQQEIIEEFNMFESPLDKCEYIIDTGKLLPPMDPALKTEENEVHGCQSKVWLTARLEDGKIYFDADSDSDIVKGIIALIIRVYNGETPDDIINHDLYFIDKVDLKAHLTNRRSNGIAGMIKKIKIYALAYKARNESLSNN